MLFLITIIFCLIVIYFIFAPKNMVLWYFSFYTIGFTLVVFASLLFVFKVSNYPNLYEFDYTLYLYLARFKMPLSAVRHTFTIGIMIMLLSNIFFINIMKVKKQNIFVNILLILSVIVYFLLNCSDITQRLYLTAHTTDSEIVRNLIFRIPSFTNYYGKFIIAIYHILPIYCIIRHYFQTNITVKKQSLIVTLICTILLYTNILHMISGDLSTYFMLDFNNFPINEVRISKYMLMLMLFLFIITLIFSLLIFFQPFRNFTFTSAKIKRQNSNTSYLNLRMFLHTQKNIFVAISKFSQLDFEECGNNPGHAYGNLQIIKNLADNTIDNLAKNLDMLRSPKMVPKNVSVCSLIDSAAEKMIIPNNITVDKEYPPEPLFCMADTDSLQEVFTNILSNAVEAIEMAQRTAGKILIQITYDSDLICISISDNGCGIDKKNMKYLFEPLFSTKSTQKNYGLGLSYAKEVIRLHNGYITITSVPGSGTKVQTVLPKITEKFFGKKYGKTALFHCTPPRLIDLSTYRN